MKKIFLILMMALLSLNVFAMGGSESQMDTAANGVVDSLKEISTADVEKVLQDKNVVIVDARSNDVFNGWAILDNSRGGHIQGATDFSALWIDVEYDDSKNLEKLTREEVLAEAMKNKGITSDKQIILYDTNGKDAKVVAKYFAKKGIKKLAYYNATKWVNDKSKKLVSYPNYELLVPAEVVNKIANGNMPKNFSKKKKVVITYVNWGDEKASGYSAGHVPGSIHINSDWFEPPTVYNIPGREEWRLADDKTLAKLLMDKGITKDTLVISTSPEPMAASRFATICKYIGVEDVRVMNGALTTWKAEGYKLETKSIKPNAVKSFGVKYPAKPNVIDTIEEAKKILADKKAQLVDNRTWEEYIGKSTGYSYHDKAGRIPGSIFGHAGLNSSYSMYYYRNIDKTMRNQDEIKKLWISDGLDLKQHMSFFCGSGWRAAEILWYSYTMGMKNTSLFSDGWISWSNDNLPFEKGNPKK